MVATQRTGCSGLKMVPFQLIWHNGGREGGSVGSVSEEPIMKHESPSSDFLAFL